MNQPMRPLFDLEINNRTGKSLAWKQIERAHPGFVPEKKKSMAYNKFTLEEVVRAFGLKIHSAETVVGEPESYPPSDFLRQSLERGTSTALKISTEKARSEFIVAPILLELQVILQDEISFFSGIDFTVDKLKGLSGKCDFIFSLGSEQEYLTAPAVTVVEAKNDNIKNGLGQCVAEMVAAQIFNQQKNINIQTIYGVVTTGVLWRFLKLKGNDLYIEDLEKSFTIADGNIGKLLGIFIKMLEKQPTARKIGD